MPCARCGRKVRRRKSEVRQQVFCSQTCSRALPFKNKGRPVTTKLGDRRLDSSGYAWVYIGRRKEGPYQKGWQPEHRLVMAQLLDRSLESWEHPHHKNGVKSDNRPENLELWACSQPKGQRPADLVDWAREIIERYGAEAQAHPGLLGAAVQRMDDAEGVGHAP